MNTAEMVVKVAAGVIVLAIIGSVALTAWKALRNAEGGRRRRR